MTHTEIAHLRVRDPGSLIDAVPYLLGFHAVESLVLLGLDSITGPPGGGQAGQVKVVLRVDIPTPPVRAGDFDEVLHALRRSEVTEVVCLWLTDCPGLRPHRDDRLLGLTSTLLGDALSAHLDLVDVLVASADRWWSLFCADPHCCSEAGIERGTGTSVIAAQATVAGLVALPERASVQSQLLGDPGPTRERLRPLVEAAILESNRLASTGMTSAAEHRTDQVAILLAAAERCLLSGSAQDNRRGDTGMASRAPSRREPRLTDAELAGLTASLQDVQVRDELWLLIDEGSIDATGLLYQLLSRSPAPYDAPALFLFGWSRWRDGDGTLAAMAAEQALESDQVYSAAELLLMTVRGGLDPRRTSPLRAAAW